MSLLEFNFVLKSYENMNELDEGSRTHIIIFYSNQMSTVNKSKHDMPFCGKVDKNNKSSAQVFKA